MDFQTNNILLQMLMVLFPIILYQALVNNRKLEKYEPFYWSFVFSITMILCLTFAIKLEDGILIDLRMVPWFLAYIYGGKSVGIFVTVFYVIIRFFIGGEGMIPAFTVILIGTIFIWRFRDRFSRWERRSRILHSILFLIFLSTLIPICGSLLIGESITGI
ncbi:LytS/YhcK type 5TM receptor domain-containing protein [Bacillus sp. T3]|uniref:LytS/YhcK type 5TM receptor domain-containing protein n=1 Tax=Bacillus sp. T3 TaxID=467262 RepID=UPI0029819151|nr:LytS/YhcK type 5TM receptor domain-containing protein [Bacillus sp. T3]